MAAMLLGLAKDGLIPDELVKRLKKLF